jgi:methylated-DNA-[protein]-cysteine S-methyltransferase
MSADELELELELAAGPVVEDAEIAAATDAFTERAEHEGLVDVAWTSVDSPIGPLAVAGTDAGLACIGFGDPEWALSQAARLSSRVVRAPRRLDPVRRELDEYFEGRRHHFDLPIDWRLSRGYRQEVLRLLFADVGFGQTVSYHDLAVRTGRPGASRAVGTSMATNPIPIIVPCHRVLRSGGALGGYAGGLDVKRWLLRHEGALLT